MGKDNYKDKDWLEEKLDEEELLLSEIADICEVSISTISRWADRFEIREIRHYQIDRRGANNPFWKGGRYKDSASGYVMVYSIEHPNANKKGYVLEHRLVMEGLLERPLKSNEIVQHKNGKKDDNRPENLDLYVLGKIEKSEKITCPFCENCFKIS